MQSAGNSGVYDAGPVTNITTPLVSIVIPTYARPEQLHDCLRALARQTMAADAFEVVVVDDGSATTCSWAASPSMA